MRRKDRIIHTSKACLGVAAVDISQQRRRDQITDPGANRPSITLIFVTAETCSRILIRAVQIHEIEIGHGADHEIRLERAELIIAAAAPTVPNAPRPPLVVVGIGNGARGNAVVWSWFHIP